MWCWLPLAVIALVFLAWQPLAAAGGAEERSPQQAPAAQVNTRAITRASTPEQTAGRGAEAYLPSLPGLMLVEGSKGANVAQSRFTIGGLQRLMALRWMLASQPSQTGQALPAPPPLQTPAPPPPPPPPAAPSPPPPQAATNPGTLEAEYTGIATWYGGGGDGYGPEDIMADGTYFDPNDPTITAANLWPLSTWLRVCHLDRCINVQVRDRGAFSHLLDLSYAAFSQLASPDAGVIDVAVSTLP